LNVNTANPLPPWKSKKKSSSKQSKDKPGKPTHWLAKVPVETLCLLYVFICVGLVVCVILYKALVHVCKRAKVHDFDDDTL